MRTTFYDRAAAMLLALLILFGTCVAVLLGLYLSSQVFGRTLAVPVALVPAGDGGGTGEADEADPNVTEPGMEAAEDRETSPEDSLESVVDIISTNPAFHSAVTVPDDALLIPGGKRGDGRVRGDGNGASGRIRRWEVNLLRDASVDEYAKMLDFFGIELGILKPGGKVIYISQLSAVKPVVREGNSADEQRYYLTWLKGDSENADRELLDRAGVDHRGKLVIKFLPAELENDLAAQEQQFAKERLNDVRGSFFRVDNAGGKYKFVLYNQLYQ
ncbi:MAG: hypothetical protein LBN39_01410 [Planctomycetaceae bacterium]|jgi:hypothetical protein|nr:hypothetical protein [Planctomycetaceae bacterium]